MMAMIENLHNVSFNVNGEQYIVNNLPFYALQVYNVRQLNKKLMAIIFSIPNYHDTLSYSNVYMEKKQCFLSLKCLYWK